MAIDVRRVILAAVQAGLEEPEPKRKSKKKLLPARRALLIGAGIATVGRVAMRTRGDGIVDAIQQRVAAMGGDDYEDEEYDDEEELDDDEEFEDEEEPEGEADEDFDDEEEPDEEDVEDEDVAEDEQSPAPRRS